MRSWNLVYLIDVLRSIEEDFAEITLASIIWCEKNGQKQVENLGHLLVAAWPIHAGPGRKTEWADLGLSATALVQDNCQVFGKWPTMTGEIDSIKTVGLSKRS